jgi:hypothetical protein
VNLQYSRYKCGQDLPSFGLRETFGLALAPELGGI